MYNLSWICPVLHLDLYNSSHRFVQSLNWSVRVCFWPYACFWCPGLHRSLFQWIFGSSKFNTRRTFVDLLMNSLLLWSSLTGPLIVCTETVSKELIVKKEHFILKYKSSCTKNHSNSCFYTHLEPRHFSWELLSQLPWLTTRRNLEIDNVVRRTVRIVLWHWCCACFQ